MVLFLSSFKIRDRAVLYWVGCGLAVLSITMSLIYAGMFLVSELGSLDPEDPLDCLYETKSSWEITRTAGLALLVGFGAAVVIWLAGKAARYVLANK
jgi:hypothetical protein